MEKRINLAKRYTVASILFAFLALLACLFFYSTAQGGGRGVGSDVFVGQDGKTYGVPYPGDDGNVVIPDMVRVRTSSGEFGYVSYNEMQNAIVNNAQTQEDSERTIDDIDNLKAEAFCTAVNDRLGTDSITCEEAFTCTQLLTEENGFEKSRTALTEKTAVSLAKAIRNGELSVELTEELLKDAVSSGRISRADMVLGFVADKSSDGLLSLSATNLSDDELLHEFATHGNLDRVSSEDVSISENLFMEIYSSAQPAAAVSVPLYSEEGKVIGEYPVNRL